MMKLHVINILYSLFLIVLGLIGFLIGYLVQENWQLMDLIPLLLGLFFLTFSKGIKQGNKKTIQQVSMYSLIITAFVVFLLVRMSDEGFVISRKTIIFGLTGLASLNIFVLFMINTYKERRQD